MLFTAYTMVVGLALAGLIIWWHMAKPAFWGTVWGNNNNWARVWVIITIILFFVAVLRGFGPPTLFINPLDEPATEKFEAKLAEVKTGFNSQRAKQIFWGVVLGNGREHIVDKEVKAAEILPKVKTSGIKPATYPTWFWWKAFLLMLFLAPFVVLGCYLDEARDAWEAVWDAVVSRHSASGTSGTPQDVASAKVKGGWTFYKDLTSDFIAEFGSKVFFGLIGK